MFVIMLLGLFFIISAILIIRGTTYIHIRNEEVTQLSQDFDALDKFVKRHLSNY